MTPDVLDLVNQAILQEHNTITDNLLAELTRHLADHRKRVLQIVSANQIMDPQPSSPEKNLDMTDPVEAIHKRSQGAEETKDVLDLCSESKTDPDTALDKRKYHSQRLNGLSGERRQMSQQDLGNDLGIVSKIVRSTAFEVASAGLILSLMVVMCAEIQYHGMNSGYELNMSGFARPGSETWPYAQDIFKGLGVFFNVMFALEVVLRVIAYKCKYLKTGWFLLDFILVAMSWLDVFGLLHLGLDPMILRLLRLGVLLRLVKVFKAFQVVDTLLLLIKSIESSFGVLLWSSLLLILLQTATGMALSQLLSGFINDESKPVEVRKRVFQYFGTMSHSCLTMFEIIQGNWVVTCRLLYDEVSEWYGLFYIIFRCLIMFAIIKVITAVFIAETQRNANSDDELALTKKQRQKAAYCEKLQDVFVELDNTGDGFLSWEELDRLIHDDLLQSLLHTLEIDTQDLRYVFEVLDNGDNQIDFKEFMGGLTQVRGPAKGLDVFRLVNLVGKMEGKLNKLVDVVSTLQEQTIKGKMNRTFGAASKSQEQNPSGGAIHHGSDPMDSISAPVANMSDKHVTSYGGYVGI